MLLALAAFDKEFGVGDVRHAIIVDRPAYEGPDSALHKGSRKYCNCAATKQRIDARIR